MMLVYLFVYVRCVVITAVFEDSDIGYSFLANSGKDQDEWTTALNSGRSGRNPLIIIIIPLAPSPPSLLLCRLYVVTSI